MKADDVRETPVNHNSAVSDSPVVPVSVCPKSQVPPNPDILVSVDPEMPAEQVQSDACDSDTLKAYLCEPIASTRSMR